MRGEPPIRVAPSGRHPDIDDGIAPLSGPGLPARWVAWLCVVVLAAVVLISGGAA